MDHKAKCDKFTDIIAKFTAYAGVRLPDDVTARLKEMRAQEDAPMARLFYDAMFDDLIMADKQNRPCCQDTGVIQYFVKAGSEFPLLGEIEDCLREAVIQATAAAPLRPNAVEIFDEINTGNNTAWRIPWIDWEIIPHSADVQIYVYMAGGGCSLPGTAKVFMPLEGYEGVIKFVFDQITSYGVNACPPLLIGIGIAGSVETASALSKKALLRPIGSRNANPLGAELETVLEKGLNDLKLGPGGIAGKNSVMGVHIEHAGRHPSTLAAGLSTGCWAHRRAMIKITPELEYEMISHKGAVL